MSTFQLFPDSALSVMFSGRHFLDKDIANNSFILDREYKYFSLMIFYLENLKEIPQFKNEMDNALFK